MYIKIPRKKEVTPNISLKTKVSRTDVLKFQGQVPIFYLAASHMGNCRFQNEYQ